MDDPDVDYYREECTKACLNGDLPALQQHLHRLERMKQWGFEIDMVHEIGFAAHAVCLAGRDHLWNWLIESKKVGDDCGVYLSSAVTGKNIRIVSSIIWYVERREGIKREGFSPPLDKENLNDLQLFSRNLWDRLFQADSCLFIRAANTAVNIGHLATVQELIACMEQYSTTCTEKVAALWGLSRSLLVNSCGAGHLDVAKLLWSSAWARGPDTQAAWDAYIAALRHKKWEVVRWIQDIHAVTFVTTMIKQNAATYLNAAIACQSLTLVGQTLARLKITVGWQQVFEASHTEGDDFLLNQLWQQYEFQDFVSVEMLVSLLANCIRWRSEPLTASLLVDCMEWLRESRNPSLSERRYNLLLTTYDWINLLITAVTYKRYTLAHLILDQGDRLRINHPADIHLPYGQHIHRWNERMIRWIGETFHRWPVLSSLPSGFYDRLRLHPSIIYELIIPNDPNTRHQKDTSSFWGCLDFVYFRDLHTAANYGARPRNFTGTKQRQVIDLLRSRSRQAKYLECLLRCVMSRNVVMCVLQVYLCFQPTDYYCRQPLKKISDIMWWQHCDE
jgi:hypothetical protein